MNHFQIKCPKCFRSDFWKTADNRFRCKNCRYIFTPRVNPLNIPNEVIKEVISEFLLEHSTNIILERVNISKYKLLKILTLLRILITKDVPATLRGIMKLDEDYFDNQIKKIIKRERIESSKLDSSIKHPIIGILCKEEKVYAKILPDIEAKDLKFLLKNQNKKEASNHSEEWQKYIGLAFKSSLYRLVPQESKKYQIDTMVGFWGYLKRKLSAKGGIRKEKLPLYLGEYAWQYNHRKLTLKEQEEYLLNLLFQYFEFTGARPL